MIISEIIKFLLIIGQLVMLYVNHNFSIETKIVSIETIVHTGRLVSGGDQASG